MKKLLSVLLAIVTSFLPAAKIAPLQNESQTQQEIIPLNQNTLQTQTNFYITENGMAHVYVDYIGYQGVTDGASISILIEKENGTFFKTVYEKTVTASGEYYYNAFEYPLAEEGIYHCTVVYTVSGMGTEKDSITFQDCQSYFTEKNETPIPTVEQKSPSEEKVFIREPFVALGAGKKHLYADGFTLFLHGEQGHIATDPMGNEHFFLGDRFGLYRHESGTDFASLYCEKEGCSHLSCGAVTAYGELFAMGNSVYQMENGTISVISPDGNKKIVWTSDGNPTKLNEKELPLYAVGWRNPLVYGEYLYITANDENGKAHVLQFDAKTGAMCDLTENTGNFMHYRWIHNGILYGLSEDRSAPVAYDLFLQKEKPVSEEIGEILKKDFRIQFIREESAFGILYGEKGENLGILCFNIQTGETKLFSNDILGAQALAVLYASEEHIWFLDTENRGNIWRMNMDGTEMETVYADETMHICAYQMIFDENQVILYAQKIGMIGGKEKLYADGFYIGALDESGKIENLRWLKTAP